MTLLKFLGCGLLVVGVLASPAVAMTDLSLTLDDVWWETSGNMVIFTLSFYNPDVVPTEPVSGTLSPTVYGAFLDPGLMFYPFDLPPIPPESFFDVVIEIPWWDLPETAEEVLPWDDTVPVMPCPADDHWDGNVDIVWSGPGGSGMVEAHYGTIQVCNAFMESFIHITTQSPWPATFVMMGDYCGLNPWLVNEDFSHVPDPLPPGWSGWIRISADRFAVVGDVCRRTLRMTSGGQVVDVHFDVEVCDCTVIPNEEQSWSEIKTIYR